MTYIIENVTKFTCNITETQVEDEIKVLHLEAKAEEAQKLDVTVKWNLPKFGVYSTWSPGNYKNKEVTPEWGVRELSCATSMAPVFVAVSHDDRNRQTIACSDGKNRVLMHMGAVEDNGDLQTSVRILVDYPITHYEADIRIDLRDIPFYHALDDVRVWWESFQGYEPASVPMAAYEPVYSTWYSFHHEIDVPEILKECKYFSALGCKTVIVDAGWHTDDMGRGYDYCGDWRPTISKVPDMKKFVDDVHKLGMKFVLWYSVPYVGAYSEAYTMFKDKMLGKRDDAEQTYIVDPRYPEVREYLIGCYKKAVLDWGLDGFKLDFVDAFTQSNTLTEGMDYSSVYDAVDKLLKDVIQTLREMKPDILIEFRWPYTGPLMRSYGNMFRSFDCPHDSWGNCVNTLALRMLAGQTAVHSDMVMWNEKESVELAAYQLTHTLFSVPQISVRSDKITGEQKKMIANYLMFWSKYQKTLLFGDMLYKGYVNNYLYVSARSDITQIGVVYAGRTAYIEEETPEIIIWNASPDKKVLVEGLQSQTYCLDVYDCMGDKVACKECSVQSFMMINDVPINGRIVLTKKR